MATVINNPGETQGSSGFGPGVVLGIIVAILIVIVLAWIGLRGFGGGTTGSDPNIQVPDRVDINVNK